MESYASALSALLASGVRFLVVGGFATIAHGYVRATDDLDLWIEATLDNAARLREALVRFGLEVDEISVEDLADPYSFLRIGTGAGRRIDLIGHAEGLVFCTSWPRRFETELFGHKVPFIALEDLLKNKEATGRHKDLADVAGLRALHRLRAPVDP